ncbi:hypothetical protein CANCADRAFT_140604 [Tortispora caseinolytica NRRL Y-17796]|uniref:E3 ubiquitin protein ligase n=1 Tax=Tortispora caseinolytica NRRL Y-17796 TaxID=767744 RepID=A0A1E4TCP3_9ASCO|nr:hypothetical protein CANCADRAFT_140604 [Tortispora caseinolytica NRRL Y-17796]
MEDRKRTVSDADGSTLPSPKRQALDKPDDIDVDLLSSNGLENVRKDAILRQMKAYKRDIEVQDLQMNNLQGTVLKLSKFVGCFEAWLDQVVRDLGGAAEAENLPDWPSKMLSESSDVEEALHSRASSIKSLLSSLPRTAVSNDSDSQIAQLSRKVAELRSEITTLSATKTTLEASLAEITDKYRASEKAIDRLRSPIVAAVNHKTASTDSKLGYSPSGDDSKPASNEDSSSMKKLADLELSLTQSAAVISQQSDTIAKLDKEVLELQSKVLNFESRVKNISEEEVIRSAPYKILREKYDATNTKLSSLSEREASLAAELTKIQNDNSLFNSTVQSELKKTNSDLQLQLGRAEQDVNRIRAARDDLLQELSILKSRDTVSANKEAIKLSEVRLERIKQLESEIAILRSEGSTQNVLENGTDSLPDTVDELQILVRKFKRKNSSLLSQLPSLEAAFKKAHEIASSKVSDSLDKDERMLRLQAEKAKADQKYFTAMRAKDALYSDKKSLEHQVMKGTDAISQLKESEKVLQSKVTNLLAQITELEIKLRSSEDIASNKSIEAKEKSRNIESLNDRISALTSELHSFTTRMKNESELRRKLEEQLARSRAENEQRRKIATMGGNTSSAEFEALRSIAICSVCSRNWKDTAIKSCGHAFCMECAKDRLNARLRKCPTCNQQYSHNDLLSIHL